MKIKELPNNEKPREKAIHFGIETLSNAELISIVLRTGFKDKSVIELSYDLLNKFNGLQGLKNLSYQELIKVKGLKEAKAISLLAMIEFSKRINYQSNDKIHIDNHRKVFDLLEPIYSDELQEKLVVLFLNKKEYLIAKKELFVGGLDHHLVHPRDIFREAVKENSAKIIIVHNHPSGDSSPSVEDKETTYSLIKQGKELGIQLLDHIIIGKGEYFSFAQNNKFNI